VADGQDEVSARALLDDLQQRLARGPHEALGIPPSASLPEIRLAFLELAKTYHPTKFARQAPDIQRQATEMFLALRAAYEGLGKEVRRQSQPAMPARQPNPGSPLAQTSPNPAARPATAARPPTPAGGIPAMPVRGATPPGRAGGATRPPLSQPIPTTINGGNRSGSGAHAAVSPALLGRPEDQLAPILEQVQRGQWEAARAALIALTGKFPTVPRFHAMLAFVRGREAQLARRLDEARVELMHALQLDPDLEVAKTALAELFSRRK